MKKVSLIFLTIGVLVTSCRKNITDINNDTTQPGVVPSQVLFSNAQLDFADLMAQTNVNFNNCRLYVQHWVETTYTDETRYNLNNRSIPDNWFAVLYRDVIRDLTEASRVVDNEVADPAIVLDPGIAKNRKAINEILIVNAYYVLIASFGDVPYADALNIDNLQPKYDKAETVFNDIAKRLDNALAALNAASDSYGTADLYLGGDIAGWQLFGNSLKMKMGMLIADSDPAKSKRMVEEAAPNIISSNAENIKMNYLDAPPNTNPVWEDLVQSGREDFVGAKPFIDSLNNYSDPRLPEFFNPASSSGTFVGEKPGLGADPDTTSHPSDKIADPTNPYEFFSYSEMEFYKAEAVERGYNIGAGDAETHYNNAVTASIDEWGAAPGTYLAQPAVSYTTSPGTYKQKIGVQSWIAFYNRGFDAWTQLRRLDYPKLELPDFGGYNPFEQGETPGFITRLTYPVVEQNLNKTNYNAASQAIGHDWKTQKLWFDKF